MLDEHIEIFIDEIASEFYYFMHLSAYYFNKIGIEYYQGFHDLSIYFYLLAHYNYDCSSINESTIRKVIAFNWLQVFTEFYVKPITSQSFNYLTSVQINVFKQLFREDFNKLNYYLADNWVFTIKWNLCFYSQSLNSAEKMFSLLEFIMVNDSKILFTITAYVINEICNFLKEDKNMKHIFNNEIVERDNNEDNSETAYHLISYFQNFDINTIDFNKIFIKINQDKETGRIKSLHNQSSLYLPYYKDFLGYDVSVYDVVNNPKICKSLNTVENEFAIRVIRNKDFLLSKILIFLLLIALLLFTISRYYSLSDFTNIFWYYFNNSGIINYFSHNNDSPGINKQSNYSEIVVNRYIYSDYNDKVYDTK